MTAFVMLAVAVAFTGCASTTPEEKAKREFEKEMVERNARSVRITRNPDAVRGCSPRGIVSDDDFKDMQKKVARMGANVALIMSQELVSGGWGLVYSYVAEVYRCGPYESPEPDPGVCPPGARWTGKGCIAR